MGEGGARGEGGGRGWAGREWTIIISWPMNIEGSLQRSAHETGKQKDSLNDYFESLEQRLLDES